MEILFGRRDAVGLTDLLGLQPLEIGLQACSPGHAYGPSIREGYLLHFIFSGKGTFRRHGRTSLLGCGDGFLIKTGELIHYEADKVDPWTYGWIFLSGAHADTFFRQCGLSGVTDRFRFDPIRTDEACFRSFLSLSSWQAGRDLAMLSAMMRLFAEVFAFMQESESMPTIGDAKGPIDRLCRFIADHYAHPLTLDQMAAEAGLNPRYLCTAFRSATGMTPHAYLTSVRMTRACELLRDSRLAIGSAARSVGYEDPLHFSRMFRRMFGMSPKKWRQTIQIEPI